MMSAAYSESIPLAQSGGETLVQVKQASKHFDVSEPWLNRLIERKPRRFLHAVDQVSFEIKKGETFGLVGESGCGKSTVARLLVGLYDCSGGEVRFEGYPLQEIDRIKESNSTSLRRKIQMIFQDPYASLNPRWTVGQIVAEPLKVHRLLESRSAIQERVAVLLGQVGLAASDAARYPHQFSGGRGSASRLRVHLLRNPSFWFATNPPQHLMFRSRRRYSTS